MLLNSILGLPVLLQNNDNLGVRPAESHPFDVLEIELRPSRMWGKYSCAVPTTFFLLFYFEISFHEFALSGFGFSVAQVGLELVNLLYRCMVLYGITWWRKYSSNGMHLLNNCVFNMRWEPKWLREMEKMSLPPELTGLSAAHWAMRDRLSVYYGKPCNNISQKCKVGTLREVKLHMATHLVNGALASVS